MDLHLGSDFPVEALNNSYFHLDNFLHLLPNGELVYGEQFCAVLPDLQSAWGFSKYKFNRTGENPAMNMAMSS